MCDTKSCPHCGKKYTAMKSVYRHIREDHPSEALKNGNNECGICSCVFLRINDLHSHIQQMHKEIDLKFEELTFRSLEDFEEWKIKMESETQAHYVKRSGEKKVANGSKLYYYCNRSGSYQTKEDRERRLKNIGCNKINSTCPAYIAVNIGKRDGNGMIITASYQREHIGHKTELGRMPLNQAEKCELAGKLILGVPKSTILNEIRNSYSPTKRMSLTTMKDLNNICRDYKTDQDIILHENDLMSIDAKVKKMQQEDNSILIYKPVGAVLPGYCEINQDNFLLGIMNHAQLKLLELYGNSIVMMDSTHGTNNQGCQLTTIMIADENHEGFPVAILYSKTIDEETFIPFLKAIQERCPKLHPRVFMSDDAPAFYNAWKSVFGEAEKYLICAWHIKRSWQRNVRTKIKDAELRKSVSKALEEMISETDKTTFERISLAYIEEWMASPKTNEFAAYFVKHYMKRVEQWAYCFRCHAQVNTNMKLERWHRAIKYEEANGKVITRLDKSLSLVLTAITKKLIGRMVCMERGKLTKRVQEIRKRHDRSKTLDSSSVIEIEPRMLWVVPSSQAGSSSMLVETYDIKYEKDCSCSIRCPDCNICIHQFSCTCIDYSVRFVICKHIHLVCQSFDYGFVTCDISEVNDSLVIDMNEQEFRQQEEQIAIASELKKSVENGNIEEEKALLLERFQKYLGECSSMDQIKELSRGFENSKARIAAMAEAKKNLPSTSSHQRQPVNKNIDVQRISLNKKLKRKQNSLSEN